MRQVYYLFWEVWKCYVGVNIMLEAGEFITATAGRRLDPKNVQPVEKKSNNMNVIRTLSTHL